MLPLENDSQLSTLNGWLELAFVPVGTDEKIWERRFFKKIDFDIEYYEEAKNGSLVPVGTIEVSTITSIEPDKSNPRIFYINTTNQYKESRTYELCAPNENMAKHWIESLRDWKAFIDKYQEIVSGDQRLVCLSFLFYSKLIALVSRRRG